MISTSNDSDWPSDDEDLNITMLAGLPIDVPCPSSGDLFKVLGVDCRERTALKEWINIATRRRALCFPWAVEAQTCIQISLSELLRSHERSLASAYLSWCVLFWESWTTATRSSLDAIGIVSTAPNEFVQRLTRYASARFVDLWYLNDATSESSWCQEIRMSPIDAHLFIRDTLENLKFNAGVTITSRDEAQQEINKWHRTH